MKNKILISLSILTILFLSACTTSQPGKLDEFAQCLTENDATMYGTEWCPHCAAQKEMFGSSFQYVNYVDCDKNRQACTNAGVKGYPTWQIGGANYEGSQKLYDLAKNTGCISALTDSTK